MKRTVTASTTTTAAPLDKCLECKTRGPAAFLPCGHVVLCLFCADAALASMSPCCPTCQLRYVDFIAVPPTTPSKLAKLIAANLDEDSKPTRPRRKSNDFHNNTSNNNGTTSASAESDSQLPFHEQLRQSPTFAQARDLYARGMSLLGDGASACTTPVIERPPTADGLPPVIPPKSSEAFKLFVQSAGLGFPFSQFMVAIMLQGGIGCQANQELSLKWLKKAATGELALAMIQLAQMYNSGTGIYKDLHKMSRLYRKAATTERSFALASYGYCVLFGHGVEQDFELAREVLLAANNAGDRRKSLLYLGLIFFSGLGVPVSPKNAFEYFFLAASSGDSMAQHWLSRCYANGLGIKESQVDAAKWAQKAAMGGLAVAQHDIGCRYMAGTGVAEDVSLGFSWTEKAADQCHIGAVVSLAFYFANGQGTTKDEDGAAACQALARQLLEEAPHKLEMGECLEFGEGSDRNVDAAKVWYRDAALSSTYAEFALSRHGEASPRATGVKKNSTKKTEVAATEDSSSSNKSRSSLTMMRPRSKSASASKTAPAVVIVPLPAVTVSATLSDSLSSLTGTSSSKTIKPKVGKMRTRSISNGDMTEASFATLGKIAEDAEGEVRAGKDGKAAKRPKSVSVQFKRSASSEILKAFSSKKTRFVPLEISTNFAAVAIN